MKKTSRVSKAAIKAVNDLVKCGQLRWRAFKQIDDSFGYIKGTMAKHFGKIESVKKKRRGKKYQRTWGEKNYQEKTMSSERKLWGKVHSEAELANA